MITIMELAELVVQMNDGSRELAEQVKALKDENKMLKAQFLSSKASDIPTS